MSGAQRQQRYLDRLLKRGTSAPELELEKAQARITELARTNITLELEVSSLRRVLEQVQAIAAAASAKKSPPPPKSRQR